LARNEWRSKRPGKILLVLTCLKEGNEERKEKGEISPENGVDQEKEKKKKRKRKKISEKKKMMMQVQAVSNAGTGSEQCRYQIHGGIEIIYCQSLVFSKYRFSD